MKDYAIRFRFNTRKAAQAAFKMLRLAGGRLNYMVLCKLLYLADRESLVQLECPLTGDTMIALPHGPVLARILNLIRLGPVSEEDEPWFLAVSAPVGYDVECLADPGDGELSNAEESILVNVFERFGHLDWKQLSRYTHDLPEWSDPHGGRLPIAFEQILLLVGKSEQDLVRIRSGIQEQAQIDAELEKWNANSEVDASEVFGVA